MAVFFSGHTGDAHPVHLHRNRFELGSVDGKPTAGVLKDVVLLKGFRKAAGCAYSIAGPK